MQEIVRAVDRVDDPQMLGTRIRRVRFLAQDRVIRELAANDRDDRVLGFDIGHRDPVEARLSRLRFAGDVGEVTKMSERDFRSGLCSSFSNS